MSFWSGTRSRARRRGSITASARRGSILVRRERRADPAHPNAKPLTPDWGQVKPFGVQSATQFGAPPPPSITSKAYADAYTEVKNYGGDGIHTPTLRTPEQTTIGIFWGYDGTP